ncbi:LON peptidase N-terminal domain and RING finger protein C14F5.10c-like [Neltuma alba]|uniref:LON peptidase N-terminal domain and RING finger protein C14F5.10c-like n=1 Tax=Neltuma alba TaxID=207710 RepID=UPI0010A36C6D|nr:LON peptidase N-terminal domain and RING finger protein C14F5.10c-like [Prosopis alba]
MALQRMEKANEDANLPDNEQEEFSKSFVCCVCLDLLYKPIVLPCGHISCFWCVHQSMSPLLSLIVQVVSIRIITFLQSVGCFTSCF